MDCLEQWNFLVDSVVTLDRGPSRHASMNSSRTGGFAELGGLAT